ncbi:MAG: four helix bundle protein [Acidobacteria bacterium]|nr:four helix bundle protein [Acidobacteriota bacterium]
MEKPHTKLIAWRKCMDLVELVYDITKSFPREEIYGLSLQMRRAAVSAPSNIAECAADRSTEQFRNFLSVSLGSLNELSTQLEIALRVGHVDEHKFSAVAKLLDECMAVTYGLKRSLARPKSNGRSAPAA